MIQEKKKITLKFTDFEIDRLTFTELEENERSNGQKISFPRYDNPKYGSKCPIYIQYPWINLDSGGVPQAGKYYKEDSDRMFLKTPLDQSNPDIVVFSNFVQNLDNKLSSPEMREKLFGSKLANKYVYQPIFRLPQEGDDEDDDPKNKKKIKSPKHPYIKLKLDYTYPDHKIKSKVYILSVDSNNVKNRTKVEDIETVDDFAKIVAWKSKIHPIAQPIKLWAQNPSKKDPTYGVTFRLIQVEMEPNMEESMNELDSDDFLNSDDETENVIAKPKSKPIVLNSKDNIATQPLPSKEKKQILIESESESESDKEDDKNDEESESDGSESSEEIKPSKKNVPKAKAKNSKK